MGDHSCESLEEEHLKQKEWKMQRSELRGMPEQREGWCDYGRASKWRGQVRPDEISEPSGPFQGFTVTLNGTGHLWIGAGK